jgi:hypothetical protein
MFSLDRETMMIVAVVLCMAGTFYIYRELHKARNDINQMKNFSSHVMNQLSNISFYENEDDENENDDVIEKEIEAELTKSEPISIEQISQDLPAK